MASKQLCSNCQNLVSQAGKPIREDITFLGAVRQTESLTQVIENGKTITYQFGEYVCPSCKTSWVQFQFNPGMTNYQSFWLYAM